MHAAVEDSSDSLGKDAPGERLRVLVVDGNRDYCEELAGFLHADPSAGYDVSIAASGRDAVSRCESETFDCLLVEYRLPDTSATGVVRALGYDAGLGRTPVIVLAECGNEDVAAEVIHAGAADYIPRKVASGRSLSRAIGNAVERSRLHRCIEEKSDELERANAQLEQRCAEIQRFYQTISHEIKTPLTAAREFIAIARDGILADVPEPVRDILDDAVSCCDQMADHFNDLVECTRAETGKLKVEMRESRVDDAIAGAVAMAQPLLKEKDVKLRRKVARRLPLLSMDTGRMVQVISNLLSNAIKHSDPGSTVVAFARKSSDERYAVELGVRDSGCGIAADDLPRIFDRLYQAKTGPRSTGEPGLGLGLAIASEIVALHGGVIVAESELGRGSTFTVRLGPDGAIDETRGRMI